jgi:recombination protein RecR
MDQDHPLNNLVGELKKFPSVGGKSAQRIAFYILGLPQEGTDRLADAIREAKRSIFYCSVCHSLTHKDPCFYCTDDSRDDEVICVVEEPSSVSAIEKTGIYKGRYHVLQGALAPLKGMGPDELKIESLLERIKQGHFREIIIATNPTVEGEATAHFLAKLLREYEINVTRLAMGLPVGSDLDYADQVTIKKSIEGRTEIKD